MASQAIVPINRDGGTIMEEVIAKGDLARLSPEDRAIYYREVCLSMGLNPLTRPFEYITLNGKLTLYATRGATDQLRQLHGVSIEISDRQTTGECYVVTARAMLGGRTDESTGAVFIGGLKGEALANSLMKAETKSKRRVTLSIVGLGWMDESEVESVRTARLVAVDTETGEIIEPGTANGAPESLQRATKASEGKVPELVTQKGMAALHAAAAERNVDHDMIHRLVRGRYQRDSTKLLTADEARNMTEFFNSTPPDVLDRVLGKFGIEAIETTAEEFDALADSGDVTAFADRAI